MAKRNAGQARSAQPAPGKAASHVTRIAAPVENGRVGGIRPAPGEPRIQEQAETTWNDIAESEERPLSNNSSMKEVRPAEDKETRIRALLRGGGTPSVESQGEATPEEGTEGTQEGVQGAGGGDTGEAGQEGDAPVLGDDKGAGEKPQAPSRRDMFDKVDAEQRRVQTERELKEERGRRIAAEQAIKNADIAKIIKDKGLTTDQALDLILSDPNAGKVPVPADSPVESRLSALERRERDQTRREARGVVLEHTKDLKIPVTRATKVVTVDDGNGQTRQMSGLDLVVATAQRLFELDGSPPGRDPRSYLKDAALATEKQLIEDQKDAFDAYAQEHRGAPVVAAPAPKARTAPKAPPTGLGRTGGGSGATPRSEIKLPEDQDDRQKAIKARFGWR